jgi:diguanylate cyclase (GGDEF)-like protein
MKILIVEDSPIERRKLADYLTDWGLEFESLESGTEALQRLEAPNPPDLVLLDWMLPGVDGLEILHRIRKLRRGTYVYTVMLTGKSHRKDRDIAMEAGADDFLSKPIDFADLRARINVGARILELQQSLRFAATHDFLTDLLNRSEILAALEREFARAGRDEKPTTIILADIDHFKRVNDTLGHAAGDEALKEVAKRLKLDLRPYDLVGRYGGEEFLLILPGCNLTGGAKRADEIRRAVGQSPVDTGFGDVSVTISMGVTVTSSSRSGNVSELLREADVSLYAAKKNGRNRVEVFHAAQASVAGKS